MRPVREATVILLFVASAVMMTWPLATHLTTAAGEDPLLNTWILDWDYYAITHGRPLFEANIFYPAHRTLAFSEHLLGFAPLTFPLFALRIAPLTIHNIALLLGFVACGYAMFLLARHVTRSTPASIVAGLAYAFVGIRFHHLPHVQYVWAAWLPVIFLCCLWLVEAPNWKRSIALAGALIINGLTSLHWLVFGSTVAVITLVVMGLRWRPRDIRSWLLTASAFVIAVVVLLPFALPYMRVADEYGMVRTYAEVQANSGRWSDWLQPNVQSKLYGSWSSSDAYGHERTLFPGLIVLLAATAGAIVSRRLEKKDALLAASIWMVAGALGALGLNAFFHRLLFEHVAAFRGIRMPARWAMVAYVGLDLLAAIGLKAVIDFFRARARLAVIGAIVIGLLFELRAAPIRYFLTPEEERPVYRWLGEKGPFVELPLTQSDAYSYLWHATQHHRPLINGVSGYEPPAYRELKASYDATPIAPDFLDKLEKLGCTLVIVHGDEIGFRGDAIRAWLKKSLRDGRLEFVQRFDGRTRGDWVFAIRRDADRRIPEELARFLGGEYTYSSRPFQHTEVGPAGGTFRGVMTVRGFAFAPDGIAEVNLLFDNGRVVVPADREPRPDAQRMNPWYRNDPTPGFVKTFTEPPPFIDGDTDMQVEIIDRRGVRVRGVPFWFRWVPR